MTERLIDKVSGIEKTSNAFRAQLVRVSDRIGCDPSDLASVIAFESAHTFSPSVRNAGAVGLIQFTHAGVSGLAVTLEDLARMCATTQLMWVEKYFEQHARANNLPDLYMAVLWPAAMGKPLDFVLMKAGGNAYQANKCLDPCGLGFISKGMAVAPVERIREAALLAGTIAVDMDAESDEIIGDA